MDLASGMGRFHSTLLSGGSAEQVSDLAGKLLPTVAGRTRRCALSYNRLRVHEQEFNPKKDENIPHILIQFIIDYKGKCKVQSCKVHSAQHKAARCKVQSCQAQCAKRIMQQMR